MPTKQIQSKALLVIGGLTIAFFVLGFMVYPYLLSLLFPHADGVMIVTTDLRGPFFENLKFAGAIALLPPVIILGWHYARLITAPHRALFAAAVIGCMVAALITRHNVLQKAADEQATMLAGTGTQGAIPFDSLMFGEFAAGGIVFGGLFAFITVLRLKRYKFGQRVP